MRPVGGDAPRHDVAEPVQQQRRVRWRHLLAAEQHLLTVLRQLLTTELTQFREKANQRPEAQSHRHRLKQPVNIQSTSESRPTTGGSVS